MVANPPTSTGRIAPQPPPTGSKYPYLDRLQDKMEERLAHKVPAGGRFCGFCFGRLRPEDERCPFCEHTLARTGVVNEIPQDVLRLYRAKQRTEATWVYGMGFVGLILASFFFVVMVLWGPGPIGHPAIAFTMLIGGGYVLARFFGEVVGGVIGFPKGIRKRDELWGEWLKDHPDPAAN